MNEIHPLCTVPTPWDEPIALSWQEITRLALPSGAVVAGDPFDLLAEDNAPFAQQVAPGRYPVRLVLGHYFVPKDPMQEDEGLVEDLRVTLAVLCLDHRAPVRWEKALPPDMAPLLEDEVWCYTVDSGSGAFLDGEALSVLHWRYDNEPDFVQQLVDAIGAHYRPTYDWADVTLELNLGANMVTFATYAGDGEYASYWGYDADGQPVCLVTDFDALETDVWQEMDGQWTALLHGVEGKALEKGI